MDTYPWSAFRFLVPVGEKFLHRLYVGGKCYFLCFQRTGYGTVSLQFGNQVLIFDDVVLIVASDMDSIYVFFRDGYGITDKENGL